MENLTTSNNGSKKKRKPFQMMTVLQLSALFRQLDKNGDGELDLDEFSGIAEKINCRLTDDFLSKIFKEVDCSGGGSLDIYEFTHAYHKIIRSSIDPSITRNSATRQEVNYIRATRFGQAKDGRPVFETYTIKLETKRTTGSPLCEGEKIDFSCLKFGSSGAKVKLTGHPKNLAKPKSTPSQESQPPTTSQIDTPSPPPPCSSSSASSPITTRPRNRTRGRFASMDENDSDDDAVKPFAAASSFSSSSSLTATASSTKQTRPSSLSAHSECDSDQNHDHHKEENQVENDNNHEDEEDSEEDDDCDEDDEEEIDYSQYAQPFAKGKTIEKALIELNALICADSSRNKNFGQKIYWWVDVAVKDLSRSAMQKYVNAFGLPNNSKFLSAFGNFGHILGKDPKSRIFAGNGECEKVNGEKQKVSSLSFFAQSMHLKNRPLVHLISPWMERMYPDHPITNWISEYYVSRFAFLFNLSMFSQTQQQDDVAKYSCMEQYANQLRHFDFTKLNKTLFFEEESDDDEETKEIEHSLPSHISGGSLGPSSSNRRRSIIDHLSLSGSQLASMLTHRTNSVLPAMAVAASSTTTSSSSSSSIASTLHSSTSLQQQQQKQQDQQPQEQQQLSTTTTTIIEELFNPNNVTYDDSCLFKGLGYPLSLNEDQQYSTFPTWLLSAKELSHKRPHFGFDSLSLHLLDQGNGVCCLVTIREMDDEGNDSSSSSSSSSNNNNNNSNHNNKNNNKNNSLSPEQLFRTGVLGRLLTGMWDHLFDAIANEHPSPIKTSVHYLTSLLINSLHNCCMDTLCLINQWILAVENEVEEMAVRKHSTHLSEIERLVEELNDYITPFQSLINQFLEKAQQEFQEKEKNNSQFSSESLKGLATINNNNNNISPISLNSSSPTDQSSSSLSSSSTTLTSSPVSPVFSFDQVTDLVVQKQQPQQQQQQQQQTGRLQAPPISITSIANLVPAVVIGQKVSKFLSADVEKLPISYEITQRFFGSNPYEFLMSFRERNEHYELKGCEYFSDRIEGTNDRINQVKSEINEKLEEQRNFTQFILTYVTVVALPLTVMTGYWGMNFDNMYELDSSYIPQLPGKVILWFSVVVTYLIMIGLAVHYRILYSAT